MFADAFETLHVRGQEFALNTDVQRDQRILQPLDHGLRDAKRPVLFLHMISFESSTHLHERPSNATVLSRYSFSEKNRYTVRPDDSNIFRWQYTPSFLSTHIAPSFWNLDIHRSSLFFNPLPGDVLHIAFGDAVEHPFRITLGIEHEQRISRRSPTSSTIFTD